MTKHGNLSHDRLTTAMFSNARTCYFLPHICIEKISGDQWRPFDRFASHKEAHKKQKQTPPTNQPTGNEIKHKASKQTNKQTKQTNKQTNKHKQLL